MDRQDRQGVRTPADLERKYRFTETFRKIWDAITGVKKSEEDHVKDRNNPHKVTAEQAGARPSTWMPTAKEVGAAADGYGLGKTTNEIATISNPETVDGLYAFGLYQYYGNTNLCGYTGTSYGSIFVVPSMWSTTQYFLCRQWYGGVLKRINTNRNGWEPWGWLNPPMLPGAEYRTVESFGGKPVYLKMVDCEGMPSGTNAQKVIEHGAGNVENIVAFGGYMSTSDKKPIALPYYFGATNFAYVSVSFNKVYLNTGGTDLKSYTEAKAWFKYTKTTD